MALDMPAEFPECATLPLRTLAKRFQISESTARAWRMRLGVYVKRGAPKGNGNAIRNQSQSKPTHGIDGPDEVRTCLSCTAVRCTGRCIKVH